MTKTMERVAAEVAVRPDTYKTLLVHAEPALASSHRVEAAARLARDLDARLIGLGAEGFEPVTTPDAFTGYAAGEWVALIQEQIGKNITAAEAAFRRDAAGVEIEWRTVQDYPHKALAQMAHAADLIIMSPRSEAARTCSADPADVVMSAGRPVLMVPTGRHHLRATSVVIAWKDTPQCRRVISDAMPLLQRAESVVVLAICKPDAVDAAVFETDDVVANLKRRGVEARSQVISAAHEGVTNEIERVATASGADLIVCGAYGHSRLREWALGGVTDDLIHRPHQFVLMSH